MKFINLLFLFSLISCSQSPGGDSTSDTNSDSANNEEEIIEIPNNSFIRQLGGESIPLESEVGYVTSGDDDFCLGVSVDKYGNSYCVGITKGGLGEENAATEPYMHDIFVTKIDNKGEVVWVKQLGSSDAKFASDEYFSDEYKAGIVVDENGNIFVCSSTLGSLADTNSNAGSRYDAFAFKLNNDGELQWLSQLGQETNSNATGDEFIQSTAIDKDGNVYCGGYTDSQFGTNALGGSRDALLAKYNSNGDFQWVRQFGSHADSLLGGSSSGTEYNGCIDLETDSIGNIYCAGSTNSNLADTATGTDAFVIKVQANGTTEWVSQIGSTTISNFNTSNSTSYDSSLVESIKDMKINQQDGSIFLTGTTNGALADTNASGGDGFIIKLSSTGALQWISQLGDSVTQTLNGTDIVERDYESFYGIELDSVGNIYIAGETGSNLFGEDPEGVGTSDCMLLKFNSDGILVDGKQFIVDSSSDNDDYCYGIAIDNDNNLYMPGFTQGQFYETNVDFDNTYDAFIIKYNGFKE